MSFLSSWILSILGIVIISLLVEIILPNGKTSKLIKSILAIFSIFVIISPLNKIDLSNVNLTSITNQINIDSNFIKNRNKEKIEENRKTIEANLANSGYNDVFIDFDIEYLKEDFNINNIFVDLREMVLNSENLNINKYTNIVAIIQNIISIEEDKIIFYE